MLWPATLIGAGAGWALASIPGALLGGLLGQLLDRRLRLESWRGLLARLRGRAVNDEDDLLFQLLGYLAKSGGRVEEMHIRQAREEMALRKLDRRAQRRANRVLRQGQGRHRPSAGGGRASEGRTCGGSIARLLADGLGWRRAQPVGATTGIAMGALAGLVGGANGTLVGAGHAEADARCRPG